MRNLTITQKLTFFCFLFSPINIWGQQICTPNEIKTTITINASATETWQLLTNFNAYTNWHPYIVKIDGEVALKEKIKVTTIDSDSTTDQFSAFIL